MWNRIAGFLLIFFSALLHYYSNWSGEDVCFSSHIIISTQSKFLSGPNFQLSRKINLNFTHFNGNISQSNLTYCSILSINIVWWKFLYWHLHNDKINSRIQYPKRMASKSGTPRISRFNFSSFYLLLSCPHITMSVINYACNIKRIFTWINFIAFPNRKVQRHLNVRKPC